MKQQCCTAFSAIPDSLLIFDFRCATMPIMLIVQNLEKSFDGNVIIKNLTFSVSDGDKLAVVGLNGAGKSTSFRTSFKQC